MAVALRPGATMADVTGAAIAAAADRLLAHDAGARTGVDPEDVHQARVATRRLRSDLRTLAPVLDPAPAKALRDELRWLAGALGDARDADVLFERIRDAAIRAGVDAAGVLRLLEAERDAAQARLRGALDSDRYTELVGAIVRAAHHPPVAGGASKRASTALPDVVRKPWKELRRAGRRARAEGDAADNAALHDVRIRAKRVRYAAEAAAPVCGKRARRFASALAGLQGVLGDLHDAVVAEAWLRDAVPRLATPADGFAAGRLAELQAAERERIRHEWLAAWKRVERARKQWLGKR